MATKFSCEGQQLANKNSRGMMLKPLACKDENKRGRKSDPDIPHCMPSGYDEAPLGRPCSWKGPDAFLVAAAAVKCLDVAAQTCPIEMIDRYDIEDVGDMIWWVVGTPEMNDCREP
eukprot:scaffold62007_cov17-Prasinocladus_malaysianus.AAC.1